MSLKRRSHGSANENSHISPPSRETWDGWVEIESEPALFNVMLKEMGVCGVKVQEVYGVEDDMLAILPQPVHALIFLFRYRPDDHNDQASSTDHKHIWFANQIPEFACATVALLNILNNIPDLVTGHELRQFKDFTAPMDPVARGDMIDEFDFVRRIHNSFARENDLLTADMRTKHKLEKVKKQEAVEKARATREAKKGLLASADVSSPSFTDALKASPARPFSPREAPSQPANEPSSPLSSLPTDPPTSSDSSPHLTTRAPSWESTRSREVVRSKKSTSEEPKRFQEETQSQQSTSKESNKSSEAVGSKQSTSGESKYSEYQDSSRAPVVSVRRSLRSRTIPDKFQDIDSREKATVGRSLRSRARSRKTGDAESGADQEADESGFHYVAYMPIGDHVWKLDGMNSSPNDLGAFEAPHPASEQSDPPAAWMGVAQPAIAGRMAQFEGTDIEYNLMAVVGDPLGKDRQELARNVKALQRVDAKLEEIEGEWPDPQKAEIKEDVIKSASPELGIDQTHIDSAPDLPEMAEIEAEDRVEALFVIRANIMMRQAGLRGAVRDALASSRADDEKARHRRHPYGTFAREWLRELADAGLLEGLADGES